MGDAVTGSVARGHCRVDVAAIRHNAGVLARAAGRAQVMAVVKANGYGHGAVECGRAALEGGATRLAVATVGELEQVRHAGIACPVLVMGALWEDEWVRVAAADGEATTWTAEAVRMALAAGVRGVHLKFDTGMGRMGARIEQVAEVVEAAAGHPERVAGLMTHFATSDEREGPNAGFMREQLLRFRRITGDLLPRFPGALCHAANSAATLREPDSALDMVRCGIALYGCSPFGDDPAVHDLRPAMSLVSRLATVKTLHSRDSAGYGRTWRAARGTQLAVIPLGYADGYLRAFGNRAHVLVGGRRVPVVGNVSMDQIAVDLGPEATERPGAEVVLMGADGDERITAEELAGLIGTINYEITCAVSPRVPRVYIGD